MMELSLRLLQVIEPPIKKHLTKQDRANITKAIDDLRIITNRISAYRHILPDEFLIENPIYKNLLDDIDRLGTI